MADIPALTPVSPALPWVPTSLLCFFSLDPALLSSATTVWLAGSGGNGQALSARRPQEPPSCLALELMGCSEAGSTLAHTGCLELPRGLGGLGQSDLNPDSPGSAPAQAAGTQERDRKVRLLVLIHPRLCFGNSLTWKSGCCDLGKQVPGSQRAFQKLPRPVPPALGVEASLGETGLPGRLWGQTEGLKQAGWPGTYFL